MDGRRGRLEEKAGRSGQNGGGSSLLRRCAKGDGLTGGDIGGAGGVVGETAGLVGPGGRLLMPTRSSAPGDATGS